MKRVVVTGASGFIGYHIVKELCSCGTAVYAVCRPGSATAIRLNEFTGVKVIYCSLEENNQLPEQIPERGFDALYHLAWEGASGPLRSDYTTQVNNIKWTGMLAEAAKKLECRKFIVASTVSELQCNAILSADHFMNSAIYLLSKRSAYELVSRLCLKLELPLVWCAFYHPIGKYNKENQLIANAIKSLLHKESPKFGPADKWFDIIAVEDLAHAFVLAGEQELSENWYFIGSGEPRILRDYLTRVGELIAPDIPLLFDYYPDDGLPMQKEWLDISKFTKETGYQPQYTFDEAVINTRNGLFDLN